MNPAEAELVVRAAAAGARYLLAKAATLDADAAAEMVRRARREAGVVVHPLPYSQEESRATLHALADLASGRMRSLALSLAADLAAATPGDVAALVEAWRSTSSLLLKRALLAAATVLVDRLGDDEGGALDAAVAFQDEHLRDFADAVAAGEVDASSDGFLARAASYGASAWGAAYAVATAHAVAAGLAECRRVLGAESVHCERCPELERLGWVPIADAVPIGETPCMFNCRCYLEFR